MRDFNFFSAYLDSNKKSMQKWVYGIIALGTILILTAGFMIYATITFNNMEDEIAEINLFLNSKEVLNNKLLMEQESLKNKLLTEYNTSVATLKTSIQSCSAVKSSLLETLATTLPKNTVFNSVSITGTEISIQAMAGTRTQAAELIHNLEGLNLFSKVYLDNMSIGTDGGEQTVEAAANAVPVVTDNTLQLQDGPVSFTVSCTLKEVTQP